MASTKQAVDAIVRRIGFDPGRVSAVARVLTEAGELPSGAPGKSPELSPQHVTKLMVATALDAPLRAVADTVGEYVALRREGVPEGAPEGIGDTAGDVLDILAEIAAAGSTDAKARAANTIITVVNSWPETVLVDPIDTRRFSAGEPGRWQAYGHRKSVEINGGAFVDVINDLFGDHNA
ncbi:hypothetical protein [Mesorhizobium dulcispinae]|uniref:hypothetical protein n=1 Tax=Mesorhizobium dulcispinae TaxID=3072316 RepID=UPI002A242056|nr:hypothetical protein [Mesorhizobium sp. VK23D]MDX8521308.1 hypothetical protein [Mesorhizobium sp. VK23D]